MKHLVPRLGSYFLCLFLVACQNAYYVALEKVGIEKREVLSSRVEKAKESQQEAQKEFKDALARFRSVVAFDGGDLEAQYNEVDGAYQDARAGAEEVSERIEAVEDVAEALFEEWEDELSLYNDPSLRRQSAQQLRQTRSRYRRLIRAMRRAEAALEPPLDKLRDRALFLKHNLNAAAISALQDEVPMIEQDVEALVEAIQHAIEEADRFLASLD